MESNFKPCIVINHYDSSSDKTASLVTSDSEYESLLSKGWVHVSFKKMFYQYQNGSVKISAGTKDSQPNNPFITKLDLQSLQWLAESKTLLEFENKFRQLVGGVGFIGWKETGKTTVCRLTLVAYTEVEEGYTLPEKAHWVEVDLDSIGDLSDCLSIYEEEGTYPIELELFRVTAVDRYPVLLGVKRLLTKHKLSK